MTKQRVTVGIHTWMELNMKASGKKTNSMAKGKNSGQMEHSMKVTMCMERNMVEASLYGLMGLCMKANLSITTSKGMDSIPGQMVVLSLDSGD